LQVRIARVRVDGRSSTAVIKGRTAHLVSGNVFGKLEPTGETAPLSRVQFLVPVQPTKIVAMAVNYKSHAGDRDLAAKPEAFLKSPSSLIAHGESIVIPEGTENVHAEAEIVAVIGRRAKNINEADVPSVIFGYTCGNDVSARDWQRGDTQWWRAKSSDTFTSVGPWIETQLREPIAVEGLINGKSQQAGDTSGLVFSIAECIAFISRHMTLERGDLVFTGTPGVTGQIKPGDISDVNVEGIGVLRNPVVGAS